MAKSNPKKDLENKSSLLVSSWRNAFEEMVKELKNHPKIDVYHFKINPPATDQSIEKFKKKFPQLPSDFFEFYQECNGLFLEWGFKDKKQDYNITSKPFGSYDYGTPPGRISLQPIEKALKSWGDVVHPEMVIEHWKKFYKKPAPEELEDNIESVMFCVDDYSFYNHADIIMGTPPYVIVSTDHGADTNASHWLSFHDYLKMTLSLYGACRYTFGIGTGWEKKPKLVTWEKHFQLDKLLKKIDEEDD